MPVSRWWPHVRAALVTFHLVAISVIAFPAPIGGMDRSLWKTAVVQKEFQSWARVFHVAPEAFEDMLWSAASAFMQARTLAVRPFLPYVAFAGVDQPWRMFVGADRAAARLQLQAHRTGAAPDAWETLFEQLDPAHAWRSELFTHERLASQIARWDWPSYGGEYALGCDHLARLAFADRPDIDRVRCRFHRGRLPSPDEVLSGAAVERQWANVRERGRGQ